MKRVSTVKLTLTAFCAAVNIIGAFVALALRLPVYLDSIGTILGSALLGPPFGAAAAILSSVISGATSDVYAFYFMPVGILTGLLSGLLFNRGWFCKKKLFAGVLFLTLPGTAVSSCICAFLFGGVTSSGSSILVQILHRLGLSLTLSTFAVQILTDYLDRLLSVAIVRAAVPHLKGRLAALSKGGKQKTDGTL